MESASTRDPEGRERGELGQSPGGVGQREREPCGVCGAGLVEGATGSLEPRGAFHLGCQAEAQWRARDLDPRWAPLPIAVNRREPGS